MIKRGLLLINLGTPQAPDVASVRRYLAEFLSDKRVIDLPCLFRYLLLYGIILPFRSKKTALAYQQIWSSEGSPLLVNSLALKAAVQTQLQNTYDVQLGMRYGEPSLKQALTALKNCHEITVLPLFPHYASASTGSALEVVLDYFKQQLTLPTLHVISSFYEHPAYISAQAALIKPYLDEHDFVLFSYHGLPLRQLAKASAPCYKTQCYTTSSLVAQALQLAHYDTAFQSRLGRLPWIPPYTDQQLPLLAKKGIKRLLVVCPSFVADCLETLEEIGQAAKSQWFALGGTHFTLVPSLNTNPDWVKSLIQIASLDTLSS